ncbi:MAG: GNAT family N-acetyltransferase [Chloroflexota bacterium]
MQQGDGLLAWGAWDGARLAAQYSCLLTSLRLPGTEEPARVGMSINMAVHPDYRGQGLIKQVSQPVLCGAGGVGWRGWRGVFQCGWRQGGSAQQGVWLSGGGANAATSGDAAACAACAAAVVNGRLALPALGVWRIA